MSLYGPHPLDQDGQGNYSGTMADIFPAYRSIVVGTGLHVSLALEFMESLAGQSGGELTDKEKDKIFEDMVAATHQGKHLVVRSNPANMKRVFKAAALLEKLVPPEMIRFTGRNDQKVREAFKLRGESWKMTPRYFTVEEITEQIRLSVVSVHTENRYYYMIESGGRLLTCQEFAAISGSLPDRHSFSRRIHEIVDLYGRRNSQYVRELDFFMVDKQKFDFELIRKLDEYLQSCSQWGEAEQQHAGELYRQALDNFRNSLEPDFLRDDPGNPLWRTRMYSQQNDIPPTEESMLGVSYEFNMNIKWQPGCRIEKSRVVMNPQVDGAVRDILNEFMRFYGPLDYINLGRIMRSQSQKRAAGSYREVYIIVLR
ncbi:MAG: hypothetical protein JXQ83_05700, partial [Candidatus Glassbacteria bacterium]|nr:hypothetical protein [Candidatus Glassbacteria bacterium]